MDLTLSDIGLTEDDLFDPTKRLEDICRLPHGPLGDFSTWVVEKLPRVLADPLDFQGQNVIPRLVDIMLPDRLPVFHSEDDQGVAHLDLQMAVQAVLHHQLPKEKRIACITTELQGKKLVSLTTQLSQMSGQANILTYDDYILKNKPTDPRAFTRGYAGFSEFSFCMTHRLIEAQLKNAVDQLDITLRLIATGQHSIGETRVREVTDAFSAAHRLMNLFERLTTEQFEAFRPYLFAHDKLTGPSGVHSPGYRELDLLLLGGTRAVEDLVTDLNAGYIPKKADISNRVAYVRQHGSLLHYAQQRPKLRKETLVVLQGLWDLRKNHYKQIGRLSPNIITNKLEGTSGDAAPNNLLLNMIRQYTDAINSLKPVV